MPRKPQTVTAAQEPAPVQSLETLAPAPEPATITFDEPVGPADLTAGSGDKPEDAVPLLSLEQLTALQAAAENDDLKRDFTLKVLAARAEQDKPEPTPPPVAPRVAAQTLAEMEAGRKMNEHHAALAARRPVRPPEDTGTTSVFRPEDYVPDQRKGQGGVQARAL